MSMPKWLADRLEADGILAPGGISRKARARACKRCGVQVLAGLDDDVAALVAYADPTPLTALGEALALLADRRTYHLWAVPGRLELSRRDHLQIQARPAGTPSNRFDVLPEHTCGAQPLPTADSVHARKPVPAPGATAPF